MRDVVEPFGFTATGRRRPEGICDDIMRDWGKEVEEGKMHVYFSNLHLPSKAGHVWVSGGNIWDASAHRLRAAHPSYSSGTSIARQEVVDLAAFDEALMTWLEQKKGEHPDSSRGLYSAVAEKAGFFLANLELLTNIRQRHLLDLCVLPPSAQSKFRLPEDEILLLWRATMSLAQTYADLIRSDLSAIAENSEQSQVLVPAARRIVDSFWTDAGSRAGKDVEIVASHILSIIFGGELMLEPLEEVDKELILLPKLSDEDKHLDFLGLRNVDAPEYEIEPREVSPTDLC
uniref:Uncharacterized protein n=1 Tax=Pseudictyota dubia TaxID=2749911 RepID=A0A7R9W5I3_9STRA